MKINIIIHEDKYYNIKINIKEEINIIIHEKIKIQEEIKYKKR